MYGTLYRPVNTSPRAHAAVILIPGSGNNNRNESVANYVFLNTQAVPRREPNCGVSTINLNPFYEIAMNLARNGMIVLTYDKRGCCAGHVECSKCAIDSRGVYPIFNDECYYGCSPMHAPQKFNMNMYSMKDFVNDAFSGLEYLTTRPEVNSEKLRILGHSEGVNIAVKTMNMFNNERNWQNRKRVTNVFLMNGAFYDYGKIMVEQNYRVANNWDILKKACEQQDPTSVLIPVADHNIQSSRQLAEAMVGFFTAFVNGSKPLDRAYNVGFWTTGYFLQTGFEYTSLVTMRNELLNSKYQPFVCSLNTPTDWNYQPNNYATVVKTLTERPNSFPQVLENLTHFDTPSDLSSGEVEKRVLDLIKFCLTKGL